MRFRIGFPVDGGTPELSFIVLVETAMARFHSCKGGGQSGLRGNSGAAFIFERLPQDVRERYRFEFEPVPRGNKNTKPDNLADVGYSDSLACALAVAQHSSKGSETAPLVLLSCSFCPQESNIGVSGLILEKVTTTDAAASQNSLYHKWQAACRSQALALVLHREDADLLCERALVPRFPLTADIFLKLAQNRTARETPVVSCEPRQLIPLARAMGIAPTLFLSIGRKYSIVAFLLINIMLSLTLVGMGIWMKIAPPVEENRPAPPAKISGALKVKKIPTSRTVELDGGRLRGITQGSIFCLVENGDLSLPGVLIVIEKVENFHSVARTFTATDREQWQGIIEPRFLEKRVDLSPVSEIWQAIELIHNYGDGRLRVYVEEGNPLPPPLREALHNLEGDKVVQLVSDHREAQAMVQVVKDGILMFWAEDHPTPPSILLSDGIDSAATLQETLVRWNRARNLLALTAPETGLKVRAGLVQLIKSGGRWKAGQPLGEETPRLRHGDPFGIEFINDGLEPVYPTIIYIESDWNIEVIFPKRGPEPVPPRESRLLLSLSADTSQSWGKETVKILVCTIPCDFHELATPRLSPTRAVEQSPTEKTRVGNFLFQAAFAQKRRGDIVVAHRGISPLESEPDWTILTLGWETVRE